MSSALRPRWLYVALVASLAVNLFIAGRFAARHAIGPLGPPPSPETMLPRLVDRIASGLPAPDGETVRRVFDAHAAEIGQRSRAVGRAHNHVRDALGAEPFDPSALTAALDEVRDKEQALHAAVQQTLLETAPRLSPEARHKLADWTPMDR